MSNFAKIEIGFSNVTQNIGDLLKLRFNNGANIDMEWSAETLRTIAYQYTISTIDAFDQTSLAFAAVNADIANHPILSVAMVLTMGANSFTIEANEYGWTIVDNGTDSGTEAVLTETPEVVPAKNFELTGYTLDDAVSPCTDIEVTITENDGVSPYTWISPALASTTLVQDIARQATNETISITLEDADTDQATLTGVIIPRLFTASEISSISVVANAGGFDTTVTVFMVDLVTFDSITYSLDGSTFKISNVFTNVVDGYYKHYFN